MLNTATLATTTFLLTFRLGENEIIKNSPRYSYLYAKDVIGGRWKEAEKMFPGAIVAETVELAPADKPKTRGRPAKARVGDAVQ